jgi:outer membrane biosynthesis protein TonB
MEHTPALRALTALDDQIRAATGGEPGSGLYGLLNMMAGQFLGLPRSAMPAEQKAQPKTEPVAVAPVEPVEPVEEVEPDEDDKPARSHHRRR